MDTGQSVQRSLWRMTTITLSLYGIVVRLVCCVFTAPRTKGRVAPETVLD